MQHSRFRQKAGVDRQVGRSCQQHGGQLEEEVDVEKHRDRHQAEDAAHQGSVQLQPERTGLNLLPFDMSLWYRRKVQNSKYCSEMVGNKDDYIDYCFHFLVII